MLLYGHLGRRRFQAGNFLALCSRKWLIFLGLQWGSARRVPPRRASRRTSHRTAPSPSPSHTLTDLAIPHFISSLPSCILHRTSLISYHSSFLCASCLSFSPISHLSFLISHIPSLISRFQSLVILRFSFPVGFGISHLPSLISRFRWSALICMA